MADDGSGVEQAVQITQSESDMLARRDVEAAAPLVGAVEILEDDLRYLTDDPDAARFLGISSGTLKGLLASEVGIPADVRRQWISRFAESEAAGGRVRFSSELPLPGGPLWATIVAFPLAAPDGARPRFCVVLEHITDRMPAEQASRRLIAERELREEAARSERRLTSILESISDAFFSVDRDWRFTYVNASAEGVFGADRGDLVGRVIWEAAPQTRGTPFQSECERAVRERRHAVFEARGAPFQMVAEVHAYPTEDGLSVYFHDVSDRKKMEDALRSSEERLRLAVDAADLGVWAWDLSGARIEWDARCRQILGVDPDVPITYAAFLDCLHPEDRQRTDEAVRRSVQGEGDFVVEYRCVLPNGGERWVLARGRRFEGAGGMPPRFVGTVQDIDERKRAEAELAAADRAKDEFLAVLGHELRNPLGAISNALRLTRLQNADAPAAERAGQILARQVENMTRMVNDLLDVSRIRQGRFELRRERIDLAEVVREAVAAIGPAMDDHPLSVETPDEPVWVEVDRTRVDQALTNLLHNAARYSRPGGPVSVTLEAGADRAAIRVRDAGIGLAPEDLKRVFDPFIQVRRNTGSASGGLGIGLTLVRQIVELHGGTTAAYSEGPGLGSEFVVQLPLAGPPAKAPSAEPPPEPAPSAPCQVLIVDDNEDAAAILAEILHAWGHAADIRHTGAGALEAIGGKAYDLILLDLGLPDMHGHEIARRLRAQPGGLSARLAALTGFGQEEDRRRSIEAGCDHHLVKPVNFARLREILDDVCPVPKG